MIRTLDDVIKLAKDNGPKRLAVLAPEDGEFMLAVKESFHKGYIEPVLIGNREKMERVADDVEFDIRGIEKIFASGRQSIASLGARMLFSGEVEIEGKGQIPTSYIYRSIIKEESKTGSGKKISVISLWEIPGLGHLIAFTDTGVNITPDYQTKVGIIKDAVFLFHLLGYSRPRVSVLSSRREIGGPSDSYRDARLLRTAAASGDFGECEVLEATSFSGIFLGHEGRLLTYRDININNLPEILLVPNLDTGNILCKTDFFLNVTRVSLVITSKGAVVIPSRSDFSISIVREIAMGVVVADRLKQQAGICNYD